MSYKTPSEILLLIELFPFKTLNPIEEILI